jgi:hypothetical protein
MYRERRKQLRRRRRRTVTGVAVAVTAIAVGLPTLASADPVGDLLNNLGLGGNGGGAASGGAVSGGAASGGGTATPDAGNPPSYTPPLHGTEPHGQGTVAVGDLTPSTSAPMAGDPSQGDEELIVGDSRGQQNSDGTYHGRTALIYLLGMPIAQTTSDPGQSNDGPFQPIQDGLDQLCSASGNQLCLTVLGMHSASTADGSSNSFEALGAHIGGPDGFNADLGTSNGNISSDGTTQTAHGDSGVAKANVGPLTLEALTGTSDSSASSGGSSVNQDSTVLNIAGMGLPIPAAGCDDGTANTNFTPLSPLLSVVCNADDSNGSQTSGPYGVREALTLFALLNGDSSALKVATAGPESHAVAPSSTVIPPAGGDTPPGTGGTAGAVGNGPNKGNNGGGNDGNLGGAGNAPAAVTAAPGPGTLAFTGADLLVLAMVGGVLILGGLALTTAGRRHRRTV